MRLFTKVDKIIFGRRSLFSRYFVIKRFCRSIASRYNQNSVGANGH
ncbi:hypothetical protein [Okeania sp. SIO2B3]|nr:hypothetical protein [Okeania sp. SIO2B3]NET45743.1 hypothetical protein [Okeania sp. SIO2B3]